MTLRAFLVGLVITAIFALIIPWNDWSLQNTQMFNNYMPPTITLVILGFALVINPLLGKRRFSCKELVVIVVMLLGLGGVASSGLMRVYPSTIAAPARYLGTNANLAPLQTELSAEERAELLERQLQVVAGEIARTDADGDGAWNAAEFDGNDSLFAKIDGDSDGLLTADEVLKHYQAINSEFTPRWKWDVPQALLVGVPTAGPVDTSDPEYRHVTDSYLESRPGDEERERVHHRAIVTWRDASGTVHEQIAIGGSVRDDYLARGEAFLDLEDPATGLLLRGVRAGDTVNGPDGELSVLAVSPAPIPWYAWIGPFLAWAPMLFGTYLAMVAIAGLVRRQWIDRERLPYAIAQMNLTLMADPEPGQRFAPVLRDKGFWIAVIVVVAIIGWRGLYAYQLVPINFTLSLDLRQILTGEPWNQMPNRWWVAYPVVWFSIVGMSFFMSKEISFSLWFTFIASNVIVMLLNLGGMPVSKSNLGESTVGGFAVMCVLIIWIGRQYYWQVLRCAFGFRHADESVREAVPYFWAMLAGVGMMLGFLLYYGCDLWPSMVFILVFLGLFLVLARFVAEAGIPFVQSGAEARANGVMFNIFGFGGAAGALAPLAIIGVAMAADSREHLLPYAVNASYLGQKTGHRPRRLSSIMLLAVVIGIVLCFISMVVSGYLGKGASVDSWGVRQVNNVALARVASGIEKVSTEAGAAQMWDQRVEAFGAYTVGGLLTAGLGAARLVFTWWPVHPIGFVVCHSYALMITWASFLVGWLWKSAVMRYGGTGLYSRLKPVAIGFIAGEAVAAGIFMLVKIISALLGYELPAFKVLPG